MTVDYLGLHISTLAYLAILLFGLIIFVIIMIATEKGRQRRHNLEMKRRMHRHTDLNHGHDVHNIKDKTSIVR